MVTIVSIIIDTITSTIIKLIIIATTSTATIIATSDHTLINMCRNNTIRTASPAHRHYTAPATNTTIESIESLPLFSPYSVAVNTAVLTYPIRLTFREE